MPANARRGHANGRNTHLESGRGLLAEWLHAFNSNSCPRWASVGKLTEASGLPGVVHNAGFHAVPPASRSTNRVLAWLPAS